MREIEAALATDRTIDIVTVGAKTGLRRVTEIWFTNIEGRIVICGTPFAPRDWLANLKANPRFEFCLKESVERCLPAEATVVVDATDRRRIMSAPETRWYRNQGYNVLELVEGSPIVDVRFRDEFEALNSNRR